MYEPGLDMAPVKDTTLAYFGQKTIQVEELEALAEVELRTSGPGLVGEAYPVEVVVMSKGHPLKVGEVNVYLNSLPRALSSLTPRNRLLPATSSMAELLVGGERAAESQGPQSSYVIFNGPLQISPLEAHQSWSTTVFVRWSDPKPVNLFALLNYDTEGQNSSSSGERGESPKGHQFRVEASVHIECQEALDVSYQYVAPFRNDSLLPGGLAAGQQPIPVIALPLNEASVLAVTVKNSSALNVRLLSTDIVETNAKECVVNKPGSQVDASGVVLSSLEVYTQSFYLRPLIASTALEMGTIELSWQRAASSEAAHQPQDSTRVSSTGGALEISSSPIITRRFPLSPVLVESPPLVMTFHTPSYGLLGVPFACTIRIQNRTNYLQEVSFSVFDIQGFIFAGAHSDTLSILPKGTHALTFKLVPVAVGMQPLPQVRFTSFRYSAGFQPSALSAQLFVYPSAPNLPSPTKQGVPVGTG